MRLRALCVRARQHPVALAVGDERRLEREVRHGAGVLETGCELERALDVLAGRLEIALAPVAARAPVEDRGTQLVAREAGVVRERERLVQEPERRLDARELVPTHAESEEHVRSLDVGEAGPFGQRARAVQEVDRLAHLTEAHTRVCLARE